MSSPCALLTNSQESNIMFSLPQPQSSRRDKQRRTIRPPTPLSSLAADLDMNLGIRRSPNIKTPRRNLLNALQDSTQTPAIPEEAAMTQSPEGDSIVEDIHNAPTPKLRMSDDSSSSDNMQISPFQFMEKPRFKRSQPFMRSMSESILKSTTTIQTEQPTGFHDFEPSVNAFRGGSHWGGRSANAGFGYRPLAKMNKTMQESVSQFRCPPTTRKNSLPSPSALEEAATLGSSPEPQPVAPIREPKAKKSRTLPPQSLKVSSSLGGQPSTDEITGERSQLPCFLGGSDAIKRITPATVVDLIDGKYSDVCDEYYIIDSRYPFEYSGGHIETAININDFQELERKFFEKPVTDKKVVIIFHCEFSSQRAPMMARHLRSQDRLLNYANYPFLLYPEIYVIQGGYKAFFGEFPHRCIPQAYVQMADKNFLDELKREHLHRKQSYESRATSAGQTSTLNCSRSLNRSRPFANGMSSARRRSNDGTPMDIAKRVRDEMEDEEPEEELVVGRLIVRGKKSYEGRRI